MSKRKRRIAKNEIIEEKKNVINEEKKLRKIKKIKKRICMQMMEKAKFKLKKTRKNKDFVL